MKPRVLIAILTGICVVAILVFTFTDLSLYLRTQVVPEEVTTPTDITQEYTWTPDSSTPPGTYLVQLNATDNEGTTAAHTVSVNVIASTAAAAGSDDEPSRSSGGGGGGGGGGNSGDEERPRPVQHVFEAESGHTISGAYSGIEPNKKTVVLAHPQAVLERKVTVAKNNYYLDLHARHDRPGPVKVAVYLNNRAWKVIVLDKNDNRYRTHRLGALRNFSGGTIRFRLLNDTYDRANPTNADKDRNLHVDWWRLTTDPSAVSAPEALRSPTRAIGGSGTSSRSPGWDILPRLNDIIKEELGARYVTPTVWQYYATRLTVPANHKASIQAESELRTVMRYWRGVRPTRPYGDL